MPQIKATSVPVGLEAEAEAEAEAERPAFVSPWPAFPAPPVDRQTVDGGVSGADVRRPAKPMSTAVLFLCTGNYYRSRFAEEYFNHHARSLALPVSAYSKGLARDMATTGNRGPMSPDAVRVLERLGVAPIDRRRFPESVDAADFSAYARIVVLSRHEHEPMMRAHFRDHVDRVEYLDIEDVHLEPVESALARLAGWLDGLIAELAG
jgi:protein-tyrosine phosphatase